MGALSDRVNFDAADFQEFTSSGTWTKPAGARFVYVEAIGGGGGGANHTSINGACGGAGGEFVSQVFNAGDMSATETVTIGAGASGGANGGNNSGSTGGDTTFGSHLTAKGGAGGSNNGTAMTSIPRSVSIVSDASAREALRGVVSPQAGWGAAGSSNFTGGSTIYGGAGGGGASNGNNGAAGTSEFGGDGGAGNQASATKGGNGTAPGGGGGASCNDGGGGDGAAGRIRVWSW